MAVYTDTMFIARNNYKDICKGRYYELVVTDDADYLMDVDTDDMYEIRVDPYDNDVVFLRENQLIRFDKNINEWSVE